GRGYRRGGDPRSGRPIAPDTTPPPGRLEAAWRRLCKADELVRGFGEQGWIADATLVVVDDHGRALARRVGRLEERGETAEEDLPGLRREVEEHTALLVALADEAVAQQPSLAPDTPVPVTLQDAHRRLDATTTAYD